MAKTGMSRSRSRGRPTSSGKRRRITVTPPKTPAKPRHVVVSTRRKSASRSRSAVRNASREESNSIKNTEVYGQFKKAVSFAKKPIIKITSQFKKQVSKALEGSKNFGNYTEIYLDQFFHPFDYNDRQIADRIGSWSGTNQDVDTLFFNPMRVLDAASTLFAGKAATKAKYNIGGGSGVYIPAGGFDERTVKILVKNSYAKMKFKNNSKRTCILTLYECAPKMNMDLTELGDAYSQWKNALENQRETGADIRNYPINVSGATPNTLYMTPNKCSLFMARWLVEKHEITLDPGQSYEHFMQGPQDVEYDFPKFWRTQPASAGDANKRFYDIAKGLTRSVMYTMRTDAVQANFVDVGNQIATRAGGDPNNPVNILFETIQYYNFEAPAQTFGKGFVASTGTNTQVHMTGQRDCFVFNNWTNVGRNPTYVSRRIDEKTGEDNMVVDS